MSFIEAIGLAFGWIIGPVAVVTALGVLAIAAFVVSAEEDEPVGLVASFIAGGLAVALSIFAASNGINPFYWWY